MLPLKNKTVLVTRSENQASEFILKLEKLGATTIALPLITTSAINQTELLQKVSNNNFNWIVFTSPNAVKFFFETISAKNITSKIAAVGSKTKEDLEAIGLTIDFIPTQFSAKQLAIEIPTEKGETFFIPRSNLAKNDAVAILENRKCKIETLAIYENTSVNHSKEELITISNQLIDFITFTSGSTIKAFTQLGIEIANEKVICIGPETEKAAIQNNIKVTATANPHTIDGMIEAIKKILH
ncbi:MAG: uroporphyrinogen-III synthase [Vicingaceae bacterium]|nr:uroporphyrinogen-III synthase [Vicingaceae bacterium]